MGGLDPQDRIGRAISDSITAIFRIAIVKRSLEAGLAFLQAYGHGDPDDPDNQELLQENDIDHVQHFGFRSSPPKDTEAIVVDADGGLASIAERDSLENLDTHGGADQMPALATGDTCIYSQDGTYIFLDASGKLTIKAMTDNVEIITEAGKQIKIGQDGATYRDIAYAHNTEAGASQVAVATGLNTYMGKVDTDLAAIKADLTELRAKMIQNQAAISCILTNAADISTVVGSGPVSVSCGGAAAPAALTLVPTTAALAVNTDHSYVSSGSTKAEVEP